MLSYENISKRSNLEYIRAINKLQIIAKEVSEGVENNPIEWPWASNGVLSVKVPK